MISKITATLDLARWIVWAQRKAAEDWMSGRGLSVEQGFVLGYLIRYPGAIQRDIARVTRTRASSVTSMLQGLERRGLVERRTEPGDERSKRVHATPEGADLIAGLESAMADANEAILAPLSRAERGTLHALLLKITDQLPQPQRP